MPKPPHTLTNPLLSLTNPPRPNYFALTNPVTPLQVVPTIYEYAGRPPLLTNQYSYTELFRTPHELDTLPPLPTLLTPLMLLTLLTLLALLTLRTLLTLLTLLTPLTRYDARARQAARRLLSL